MSGDARGGNDSLTTTSSVDYNYNSLFGDALRMSGNARGGNDALTCSGGDNFLTGDASSMSDNARGGNDSLTVTGNTRATQATPSPCPATPVAAMTA